MWMCRFGPYRRRDSIAQLIAGDIDAMLMPDPFNQRAVFEGAGFIHMLTKDLWNGPPLLCLRRQRPVD